MKIQSKFRKLSQVTLELKAQQFVLLNQRMQLQLRQRYNSLREHHHHPIRLLQICKLVNGVNSQCSQQLKNFFTQMQLQIVHKLLQSTRITSQLVTSVLIQTIEAQLQINEQNASKLRESKQQVGSMLPSYLKEEQKWKYIAEQQFKRLTKDSQFFLNQIQKLLQQRHKIELRPNNTPKKIQDFLNYSSFLFRSFDSIQELLEKNISRQDSVQKSGGFLFELMRKHQNQLAKKAQNIQGLLKRLIKKRVVKRENSMQTVYSCFQQISQLERVQNKLNVILKNNQELESAASVKQHSIRLQNQTLAHVVQQLDHYRKLLTQKQKRLKFTEDKYEECIQKIQQNQDLKVSKVDKQTKRKNHNYKSTTLSRISLNNSNEIRKQSKSVAFETLNEQQQNSRCSQQRKWKQGQELERRCVDQSAKSVKQIKQQDQKAAQAQQNRIQQIENRVNSLSKLVSQKQSILQLNISPQSASNHSQQDSFVQNSISIERQLKKLDFFAVYSINLQFKAAAQSNLSSKIMAKNQIFKINSKSKFKLKQKKSSSVHFKQQEEIMNLQSSRSKNLRKPKKNNYRMTYKQINKYKGQLQNTFLQTKKIGSVSLNRIRN